MLQSTFLLAISSIITITSLVQFEFENSILELCVAVQLFSRDLQDKLRITYLYDLWFERNCGESVKYVLKNVIRR